MKSHDYQPDHITSNMPDSQCRWVKTQHIWIFQMSEEWEWTLLVFLASFDQTKCFTYLQVVEVIVIV